VTEVLTVCLALLGIFAMAFQWGKVRGEKIQFKKSLEQMNKDLEKGLGENEKLYEKDLVRDANSVIDDAIREGRELRKSQMPK
jgi:hypothetical protein